MDKVLTVITTLETREINNWVVIQFDAGSNIRMKMKYLVLLATLGLSSCGSTPTVEPSAVTFIVIDASWTAKSECSTISPPMKLLFIPANTSQIVINMVDSAAPNTLLATDVITANGRTTQSIPEGALRSYKGPCPPKGSTHEYTFTVIAYSKSGKTLGEGTSGMPFSRI